MKKTIQATINFDTRGNHPDSKNTKGLKYTDTYTIDNVDIKLIEV